MDNNSLCLSQFYQARTIAWESKEHQLKYVSATCPQCLTTFSTKATNKEFRTIQLDFGRQTGNTTFIIHMVYKLSVVKKIDTFCFFLNTQMSNRFIGLLSDFAGEYLKNVPRLHILTFQTMDRGWEHIDGSYAFVDVSCMMPEKKLEKIMESDQWEIISLL